jgi:hypothetical protein
MQAIRETHDVLGGSVTIHLPADFAARRVEVIVLPADSDSASGQARLRQRRPAPELASTVIRDDLIEPTTSPDDWDALK